MISGRNVIITGSARGLGKDFAKILLERGAKVCLSDINEEAGLETEAEFQAIHDPDNVKFVKCDTTKDEDFQNLWKTATETLGPVTLLINNAGIGNEQRWQDTINVNLSGYIRGTLLALEKMGVNKGGNGGVVINVASIAGLKAIPLGPIYAATKHAIVGLTRSLGHEFHFEETKVKVQALCPSLVKTQILDNSMRTAFSPKCAKAIAATATADTTNFIPGEDVAKALVKLLEEEKNGACLVVEADKDPEYVEAPIS